MLLSAYAPILAFGTVETLLKRVPFLRGKGDIIAATEVEGGVFTFVLLVCAFLAGIALIVPLVLCSEHLRYYVPLTRLMLIALSFSMLSAFFYYRFQAYNQFYFVSKIVAARSVFVLLFQVLLSYMLGVTGAVIGYLLCEAILCAYSIFLNKTLPRIGALIFKLPVYRMLIATGLPITIVWWTYTVQTTVDRLVSISMLGERATGYYGIGMSIATAYLILPDAVNQVLYPRINRRRGETTKTADLVPLVMGPALILSTILPLVTCVFILAMPIVFTVIVPQYLPGLVTAQMLVVGALFSGLTRGGTNLLISIDRQKILLVFILGCICINLFGNIGFVKIGWNIEGIAVSTAISSGCLAVMVWSATFKSMGFSVKKIILSDIEFLIPSVTLAVIVLSSHTISDLNLPSGLLHGVPLVAIQIFLFCAILIAIPHYRNTLKEAAALIISAGKERLLSKLTRDSEAGQPPTGGRS